MSGYSGTPLWKKLGFKQAFKAYVKNSPEDYAILLEGLPENVTFNKRLSAELDIIHLFTKERQEMEKHLPNYLRRIKQNGMIWVSWPKKSSKVVTDITEGTVRDIALPLGLVDVKVCAIDDVWSALKLVIRKENRT
jgi:hypothetical protein